MTVKIRARRPISGATDRSLPRHLLPVSSFTAVLKRWTWLLVAALAGASAIAALSFLHQREAHARHAEARATVFAAQLRDAVAEITTFGAAVPAADLTRVLPPVIDRTVQTGEQRLAGLDAVLGDPARTELLRRRLHFLRRLAATTRSPQVVERRLSAAGRQLASGAETIAREQRDRATAIARETLAGSAIVVALALLLVAFVLRRGQRRPAGQLHELADRDPLTGLAGRDAAAAA